MTEQSSENIAAIASDILAACSNRKSKEACTAMAFALARVIQDVTRGDAGASEALLDMVAECVSDLLEMGITDADDEEAVDLRGLH